MTDIVRCPACRGSKKVAKLGGVIGECNTCKGTGTIEATAKFVAPVLEELPLDKLVIESVAKIVQAPVNETVERIADTKSEPKRKVFQRKK